MVKSPLRAGTNSCRLLSAAAILGAAWLTPPAVAQKSDQRSTDAALLAELESDFARLAPQTVSPPAGVIHHPFLIPAGYYKQMWDWDGYFIGAHWANQDPADAKYLRDWA